MSANVTIAIAWPAHVDTTHEPSLPEKATEDSSKINPIWFVDFVSKEALNAGSGNLGPYMQSVLEQRSWALHESWSKIYEGGEDEDDDEENKKLSPAEKRCAWAAEKMLARYGEMPCNKSTDEWEGSGFCKRGERTFDHDFLVQTLKGFVYDTTTVKKDLEPMLASLVRTDTMKMVVLQKYDYDTDKKILTSECRAIGFRYGLETVDGHHVEWIGCCYDFDQERWAKMAKDFKTDKKKDMLDLMKKTTIRCDL